MKTERDVEIRGKVWNDIMDERDRQDAKWGVQDHHPAVWMLILGEEVGEAAEEADDFDAVCQLREAGEECRDSLEDGAAECTKNLRAAPPDRLARYRAEMVQVAAVATAAIESLDRNAGRIPNA